MGSVAQLISLRLIGEEGRSYNYFLWDWVRGLLSAQLVGHGSGLVRHVEVI